MSKTLKAIIAVALVGLGYLVFLYFAIAYRKPVQKTAGYLYEVNDQTMQAAVWKVIKSDTGIVVPPVKHSDGTVDYYNDSTQFISIKINIGGDKVYFYTLMYYRDSAYRSTKDVSELIIHDYTDPLRPNTDNSNLFIAAKEDTLLINTFERRFIEKLDKELNKSHIKEIR